MLDGSDTVGGDTVGGDTVGDDAPSGSPVPAVPSDDDALQFTHSGSRYLLGYGQAFFGIWDRQGGSGPLSKFPRTDDGWRDAWVAFSAMEPNSTEVASAAHPRSRRRHRKRRRGRLGRLDGSA